MELLSIDDINPQIARALLKIARKSIEQKLKKEPKVANSDLDDPTLNKYGMAFVTLETKYGENFELRGCIGYVDAVAPIKETVSKAAIAAAFSDPRFPPLKQYELDSVVIEITILTKPQVINVTNRVEIPSKVNVGEDGLIIEKGIMYSGLLLPQVPMEYCWDSETFLAETCIKAGLEPDCWLDDTVTVKKFQGLIIRENIKDNDDIIIMKPSDVKCKLTSST
ncbi:AmmeMemoRadiSam system protein A [Metallosphaera hakonensis]